MRILYFSRDYSPHDHRFLTALRQAGLQVAYLTLERRGHSLEDRPLPEGVEQIHWAGGQRPARLKDGLRMWIDLRRVLRQVQPDILMAGPIQTAAFLGALSGFPRLVSMSWGYDLLIDVDRGPSWRRATRFVMRHSAALLCDCDTIRQRAISFGMDAGGITAFPWGVDLEHFCPPPEQEGMGPGTRSDKFVLLSTRSWEPLYGVETIARAFCQAAASHPELSLIMLGNGSQAGRLKSLFAQAGLLERVLFPGHVGLASLPRYYQAADMYVSASHSDGSSISLLEAMACGRPALVSDIPGNREWVTPGENGWWFKEGDANSLRQGIEQAMQARPRLPEMGKKARLAAERRADWNKNFPQLLELFAQVKKGIKEA